MGLLRKIRSIFAPKSGGKRIPPFAPRSGSNASVPLRSEAEEYHEDLRRRMREQARFGGFERTEHGLEGEYGWEPEKTIEDEPWYDLVSSNVDRARYSKSQQKLQIVFKNGAIYEYDDVEPRVFHGLLTTHSPGQWVWYVIRDVYPYRQIGGGESVTMPAPERHSGRPFAVPKDIEDMQEGRRHNADARAPIARPFAPPPV